MTEMMKAMTFDCWDTLLADDASRNIKRKERFFSFLKRKGAPINPDRIDKLFKKEAESFQAYIIEHRKTQNSRDRVESILRFADVPAQETEINEIAEYSDRVALEFRPPVVSGIKNALEVLTQKYKLAVICNTGWHSASTVRNLLEDYGLALYFSHLTFSDEAGVAKPHKQIFEQTLEKLGCIPEEAVHIGDSEYSDIVGAREANMHSILFSGVNDKYKDNNSADVTINDYDNLIEILEQM
jgi:putative hydrolase of the HAD superfamily